MGRNVRGRGRTNRPALALLAAAITCLFVTIVTGYSTRLSLVETSGWVIHTDEVKLAIADCERALDHG